MDMAVSSRFKSSSLDMVANLEDEASRIAPGLATRIGLSGILAVYLFLVVLGPLSIPIASADLTGPLANLIRPVHQALFIGHGYRFFGPDPGPSHIVEYRITDSNGEIVEGRFPDRDVYQPRLRYHRWFMLSETVFQTAISVPNETDHRQLIAELEKEIVQLREQGELPNMRAVVVQRDRLQQDDQFNRQRLESLLRQIARHLLQQYPGEQIELHLRERLIATPSDVASRVKLNDDRFLSDPRPIGSFRAEELFQQQELE